jgi:beta-N-acetylhexosaminidase
MAEMRSVAAAVPELSGRSLERAERALEIVRAGPTSRGDAAAWRAEFEALLDRVS